MKERILKCKDCGKEYVTTAPNSKYCLSCSASRKGNEKIMIQPKYKRMKERKMICKLCGKEYIARTNNQKYCPGCVKTAQKTYDIKSYRKKVKRQEGERVLADFQRDLLEFAANNWLPVHVYMLKGAIECVSKGEKTYPISGEHDA